ncbi:hypothetical protein KKG22_02090 [Patescibacteria group bacterium]|nr:hypothetical protein [Patescibacteria group bacterium]MBU1721857.1 hypothetical protein [Patescibacteria group bacterium]MBU1901315.1 hypothetical protein [Patescibacteria group bacterium]
MSQEIKFKNREGQEQPMELSQYIKDTTVVVNIGNTWQERKLAKPARISKDGKFILVLEGDGDAIQLDYAPDIVDKAGDGLPAGYNIGDTNVSEKNGAVEYTLNHSGETYTVGQEIIDALKNLQKTRDLLDSLKGEVTGVLSAEGITLQTGITEVQKTVAEAEAILSMENIAHLGKRAIKERVKKLEALHTQAQDVIAELERAVKEVKGASQLEKDPNWTEAVPAAAEVKEKKDLAKRILEQIEKEIKLIKNNIEEDRKTILSDLVNAARDEAGNTLSGDEFRNANDRQREALLKQHHLPVKYQGGGRRGAPPRQLIIPTINDFNANEVKLSPAVIADYNDQLAHVEEDVYIDIFHSLESNSHPLYQYIWNEVDKKRKKQAEQELIGDNVEKKGDTLYKKIGDDFVDSNHNPIPESELAASGVAVGIVAETDYVLGIKDSRSADILKELLNDWENVQRPDTIEEGMFDFEAEMDALVIEAEALKAQVTDNNLKDSIDTFITLAKNMKALGGSLVGVLASSSSIVYNHVSLSVEDQITQQRKNAVTDRKAALKKLKEQHFGALHTEASNQATVEAEKAKKRQETAELQERVSGREYQGKEFDLSLKEAKEKIDSKKLQAALKELYTHIVEHGFNGSLSQEILSKFQDILKEGESPEFVELWKGRFAEVVAKTYAISAEETVRAKVAERMHGLGEFVKKQEKLWKQLAIKTGLTIGLVGGAATGAGLIAGGFALTGLAATGTIVAGGGVGGAFRHLIANNAWLNGKFKKGQDAVKTEQEERIKQEIVSELLDFNNGVLDMTQHLEQAGAIMSQTLRALTEQVQGTEEGNKELDTELAKLTADERKVYQQMLDQLIERADAGNETKKLQLAKAIFVMRDQGDRLSGDLEKQIEDGTVDPIVISKLEYVLQAFGGKKSLGVSILLGAAATGFIMFDSMIYRGAMGAAAGTLTGYRMAEGMRLSGERKEEKAHVSSVLDNLRAFLDPSKENPEMKELKQQTLYLKRLLHGTASPEEMTAVMYWEADEDGKQVIMRDKLLLTEIRQLVYEVEKEGVLLESPEQKMNLEAGVRAMKNAGQVLETADARKRKSKLKYRAIGVLAGATLGTGAALLVGWGVQEAKDTVRMVAAGETAGASVKTGVYNEDGELVAKNWGTQSSAETHQDSANTQSQEEGSTENKNAPEQAEPTPELKPAIELPKIGAKVSNVNYFDDKNLVNADGQRLAAEIDVGADNVRGAEIRAMKRLLEGYGHSDKDIQGMYRAQLKEWQIKIGGGVEARGFTLRPGAKIQLAFDAKGNPHFHIVAEDNQINLFDNVKEYHRGGGETTVVETNQQANVTDDNYQEVDKWNTTEYNEQAAAELRRVASSGEVLDKLPEGLGKRTGLAASSGSDDFGYEFWADKKTGDVHIKTGSGTVIKTSLDALKGSNPPRVEEGRFVTDPLPTDRRNFVDDIIKQKTMTPEAIKTGEDALGVHAKGGSGAIAGEGAPVKTVERSGREVIDTNKKAFHPKVSNKSLFSEQEVSSDVVADVSIEEGRLDTINGLSNSHDKLMNLKGLIANAQGNNKVLGHDIAYTVESESNAIYAEYKGRSILVEEENINKHLDIHNKLNEGSIDSSQIDQKLQEISGSSDAVEADAANIYQEDLTSDIEQSDDIDGFDMEPTVEEANDMLSKLDVIGEDAKHIVDKLQEVLNNPSGDAFNLKDNISDLEHPRYGNLLDPVDQSNPYAVSADGHGIKYLTPEGKHVFIDDNRYTFETDGEKLYKVDGAAQSEVLGIKFENGKPVYTFS